MWPVDKHRLADKQVALDVILLISFHVACEPQATVLTLGAIVAKGQKLIVHNVGKEYAGMYGLGIPSDLEKFVAFDVSKKAVAF